MSQLILNSIEETERFALGFSAWTLSTILSQGLAIGLEGGLGAGKTTFVAALMKSLNPAVKVSSPTYVLEHQYQSVQGILIRHWDLYRLSSSVSAGPEELLEPVVPGELRLIEWASRSREISNNLDIVLDFELLSEFARGCNVVISSEGQRKGLPDEYLVQ
jgi:tRNA threonylcarbamoyladenosine biosynthesis protein TsaE